MDLTVCGNLTLDEIVGRTGVHLVPGGSALYASTAAAFLGSKVRIITNVGHDYPKEALRWLNGRGINLALVKKTQGPTTRFRITYVNGSRYLWLLQRGLSIRLKLPKGPVRGAHLGPVFNEIPGSLVRAIRRSSGFLSLDIQGLVRRAARGGLIEIARNELEDTLRLCDLVKASVKESGVTFSTRSPRIAIDSILATGPRFAIVTLGSQGALVGSSNGGKFLVPAFPDPEIIDPTGAGDVFVGSWLQTFLKSGDPVRAASVGSAFASLTSRRIGLSKFSLSRGELARRTSWVFRHVKFLRKD